MIKAWRIKRIGLMSNSKKYSSQMEAVNVFFQLDMGNEASCEVKPLLKKTCVYNQTEKARDLKNVSLDKDQIYNVVE